MNGCSVIASLTLIAGLLDVALGGARCFQCHGIENPQDCNTVRECPGDMHCHTRKYFHTETGRYLYDLDCKAKTLCDSIGSLSDAPDPMFEIEFWTSCCYDNFCNINFDNHGNLLPPALRVMVCYNCLGIADPADCHHTTKCSVGEVCQTHEKISDVGGVTFDMGCLPRQVCEAIGHHLPFGRRHVVKRYELCRGCCDERSNCNNEFCSMKKGITNMTAIGTPVVPGQTVGPTTSTITTPSTTTTTSTTTTRPTTTGVYDKYKLVVRPDHQTVVVGSTAIYNCKFNPETNETMSMTWSFTNLSGNVQHIYTNDVQPPELTFHVKSVEATDEGSYTCEAKFGSHSWSASGNLSAIAGNLEIIQGPLSQTVQAGRRVTFSCTVSGNPTPSIIWQFVHGTSHSNITDGVTTTPTGSQMVIDAVAKGDEGVYKCLSSNLVGSKESLAVLTVEDIPTIVQAPRDQQVKLHDAVALRCVVTGTPKPRVQWTFSSPTGSTFIPPGTVINIDDSIDIPQMTNSHVGTWTCLATNLLGQVAASAALSLV
ncbi:roundabout homolog 2-like [Haliotis rufescens]|uniref:roundabout homolog 2-like n=1 Tax=Haliotis rufescens TaxID=6454 RepID=UPI00201F8D6D|nr:roundabout homolog 2-like [Haliotis rufescens]